MTKKDQSFLNARVMRRSDGVFCRCVEVKPHGKTSVRFLVQHPACKCPHEYNRTDFQRIFAVVAEDARHHLPGIPERLAAFVKHVDENCDGRIPYRPEHFTELNWPVKDLETGAEHVDAACMASPFGRSAWSLQIHLYGEAESIEIEAEREDTMKAGGHVWPVFKRHIEKLITANAEISRSGIPR